MPNKELANNFDELDVMHLMENIEYGWVDFANNKHNEVDTSFSKDYKLQSPSEVMKSKVGVCWDQVELERYYFKKTNYQVKTYFIVHYDNNRCPTHTFLVYQKNNKYYWFEHSWQKYRGIYEYDSLNDLLVDVRSKFITTELNNSYEENNLVLYEYSTPKPGLNVLAFYKHCESGQMISDLFK